MLARLDWTRRRSKMARVIFVELQNCSSCAEHKYAGESPSCATTR